jgi:hypothetical protein
VLPIRDGLLRRICGGVSLQLCLSLVLPFRDGLLRRIWQVVPVRRMAMGGLSAMDRGDMEGRSRRRRRPRYRRGHGDGQSDPAMVVVQQPEPASEPARGDVPPPCIIDWSDQVASGEEDLANAVMVSVISDEPLVSAGEVAVVLAARIDVAASSLVRRRASFWFFQTWFWLSG